MKREGVDLQVVIAGSRVPSGLTREARVHLLHEFFTATFEGRTPSRESVLFAAGGALAWLAGQGDLVKDYWRVRGPSGSHRTPQAVLASSRGAQADEDEGSVGAQLDKEPTP